MSWEPTGERGCHGNLQERGVVMGTYRRAELSWEPTGERGCHGNLQESGVVMGTYRRVGLSWEPTGIWPGPGLEAFDTHV